MVFSSSKCPLPALVIWCRAFKHSLGAGLPVVRVFRQQAKSGPRALRETAGEIADRLERGDSLEDALESERDRFPPLFLTLVAVGERSGRLEDAFRELEDYYETALTVQRDFRRQMAWPVIQGVAAVMIIAALIFVLGIIGDSRGSKPLDPLGLGLTGASGAVTFLLIAAGLAGGVVFALKQAANNVAWRAKLEGLVRGVPGWGPAAQLSALQRFCTALKMTHEAGLSADEALRYSLRATSNAAFQRVEKAAAAAVKRGGTMVDALEPFPGLFPEEFMASLMTAEESGQVTEVMDRLARNYREDAARAMKRAAEFTGYLIYAAVGLCIVVAIFRIYSLYLGALSSVG